MAYVQINARGIAGRVVNGNSISLETYDHAFTAAAAVFYSAHGDPFARQKEAARQAAKAEEDAHKAAEICKDKVLGQMSELRASVDALEILTATGDWPYPSYGDMLFNVR